MRLKTCSRCGRPFAPRVSYHGLCPTCEPHGRDHRSPTTRAQDDEYDRERKRVLVRGAVCHWCGAPATTTDHLIPVARGGGHRGNLVPCCAPCNASRQAGVVPRPRRSAIGTVRQGGQPRIAHAKPTGPVPVARPLRPS